MAKRESRMVSDEGVGPGHLCYVDRDAVAEFAAEKCCLYGSN